ncbi:4-demethylwyosine synthase TYW1, partial [Candidatus Micrarchaeota archaeon]|nr:4-demethylwyosine synthase TYW1 [Candidatus Micrarchaeota archaeon]MBU1939539.1 4-demethylwyosine synthase TYW1 [Candidatus Micrarchaeota archaeon]
REFAEKLNKHLSGYSLAAESEPSRVAMLWNGKTPKKIPGV